MSWWKNLARIGSFAAAPFTGGQSLWLNAALAGGSAAGGAVLNHFLNKGDKKNEDANPEDAVTGQLQKRSDALSAKGNELSGMSAEALAPILKRISELTGSNPQAILDATRADRGRVIDQYDTARQNIAQFGPRGGGTTSALAEGEIQKGETLASLTSNAQNQAMQEGASLGTTLQGLGLSADQLADQDLNQILSAVLTREGFDVTKRGQNMEALSALGEALGTILAAKIGGAKKPAGATA